MPLSKTQRITAIIVLNLIYAIILIYVNFDVKITHDNTWVIIRSLQRSKIRLQDDVEDTPDQPNGTPEDAREAGDQDTEKEDLGFEYPAARRGECKNGGGNGISVMMI